MLRRTIDIIAAGTALILLAPLLALLALLVRIKEGSPVFFLQWRGGWHGVPFRLIKFRTMRLNAERSGGTLTFQADPRITGLGRVLRDFKLDELPQLWNVLKGEMSLVGPHPILISQRKLYGDTYQEYVRVLPGITGLWQVSGRNDTAFARRAELDHEYIRCRSIGLDIYILFKTIEIILWRQGAY